MITIRRKYAFGLSAKVLLLTIAVAIVAEILIVLPSLANFRRDWLMQHVIASKIASLALEANTELPPMLKEELLNTAGVYAVSLKRPNVRKLVLGMPEDATIDAVYDLRNPSYFKLISDAVKAFIMPSNGAIRVIAAPDMMPEDETDIIMDERPLHAALRAYAGKIFWLSLIVSVAMAVPLYFALSAVLVRPMMRLTQSMMHYRENPENASRIIVPSGRSDEIGVAETELAALQTELSGFLREKTRLANIGLAVSKINHDLRNMLSSAQLVSDRLTFVDDPTVKQFAPRLMRALDRAITLCSDTLKYGRTSELPPKPTRFLLLPLLNEVKESLFGEDGGKIAFQFSVPPDLQLWADRDQIFRVMANLLRNAQQALKLASQPEEAPVIKVTARATTSGTVIDVSDNGPGLPEAIKLKLFKAFQSSGANGTGLGLAICAELVHAHGGEISWRQSERGTSFVIVLPAVSQ